MTYKDDALALFFNCKNKSVEQVLAGNVQRDYVEISFAQNMLDLMDIPEGFKMN